METRFFFYPAIQNLSRKICWKNLRIYKQNHIREIQQSKGDQQQVPFSSEEWKIH